MMCYACFSSNPLDVLKNIPNNEEGVRRKSSYLKKAIKELELIDRCANATELLVMLREMQYETSRQL